MNRRDFVGIAAASIFAPRFGRWYRQGSGLMVPEPPVITVNGIDIANYGYVVTLTQDAPGFKIGDLVWMPTRMDLIPHSPRT